MGLGLAGDRTTVHDSHHAINGQAPGRKIEGIPVGAQQLASAEPVVVNVTHIAKRRSLATCSNHRVRLTGVAWRDPSGSAWRQGGSSKRSGWLPVVAPIATCATTASSRGRSIVPSAVRGRESTHHETPFPLGRLDPELTTNKRDARFGTGSDMLLRAVRVE